MNSEVMPCGLSISLSCQGFHSPHTTSSEPNGIDHIYPPTCETENAIFAGMVSVPVQSFNRQSVQAPLCDTRTGKTVKMVDIPTTSYGPSISPITVYNLVAIHVSTDNNKVADMLSRMSIQTHEWELDNSLFSATCD